jgi:hypothetical protein
MHRHQWQYSDPNYKNKKYFDSGDLRICKTCKRREAFEINEDDGHWALWVTERERLESKLKEQERINQRAAWAKKHGF